jgi:hypothetical protein
MLLHDPEIRLAVAREHAESLRRQLAASHDARRPHVPLRWLVGRALVTLGLRLTREAPLELPVRGRTI